MGCYNDNCIEGGASYGDADLPCELGSGSGNDSLAMSTAGGGVLGWAKFPVFQLNKCVYHPPPHFHPQNIRRKKTNIKENVVY